MSSRFTAQRMTRLAEMEQSHFWFAGRRVRVEQLLARYAIGAGRDVLDLGCGTGSMLRILAERGCRVVGLDARPEGLAQARVPVVQGDAVSLPFDAAAFDAVLLLDVVEHVDDRALFAEVHRVLRAGGIALMTVPALPGLWSYRDEAAGHLRRYTRRTLTDRLTAAGLQVQEIGYYQFLLLPFLMVSRLLGRRGPRLRDAEDQPPRLVNAVLRRISTAEAEWSSAVRWPVGSSLVTVCRKE